MFANLRRKETLLHAKRNLGFDNFRARKKLVDEFGGGLKGTLAARRYLVDTGQLSISDVRKVIFELLEM